MADALPRLQNASCDPILWPGPYKESPLGVARRGRYSGEGKRQPVKGGEGAISAVLQTDREVTRATSANVHPGRGGRGRDSTGCDARCERPRGVETRSRRAEDAAATRDKVLSLGDTATATRDGREAVPRRVRGTETSGVASLDKRTLAGTPAGGAQGVEDLQQVVGGYGAGLAPRTHVGGQPLRGRLRLDPHLQPQRGRTRMGD